MSNKNTKLVVAALQLPTLGMQATKLDFYLKQAKRRDVDIVLLGEYVLNHFFKELESMSISIVKEQSRKHIELLKEFCIKYDMIFIAPIIVVKKDGYHKTIVKITTKTAKYYEQQILIGYEHWNEKSFFSNPIEPLHMPMSFTHNGFKIMVMAGFELHFENLWQYVAKKQIDLLLLPTSSTFGSHMRWRELIKSKAFIYGCYVLRANRLGEFVDGDNLWQFYGDTMLVSPSGEIEMMLEDKESMLIEEIYKKEVSSHRKDWGFQAELRERGEI